MDAPSIFRVTFAISLITTAVYSLTYSGYNRGLTEIPTNISTNVRYVTLKSNQLTTVGENAFSSLVRMTHLDLSRNSISTVAASAFAGTALTSLLLAHNALTIVPDLQVIGGTLKSLYLTYNRIEALSSTAFLGLNHLTRLFIGYNQLRHINGVIFTNMGKLSDLLLHENSLGHFPDFSMLPSENRLFRLIISENGINGTLPKDAFAKLTSLGILSLSRNQLTELPDLRQQWHSLLILLLSGNRISRLAEDAFQGFSQLNRIDLTYNVLMELPPVLPLNSTLRSLSFAGNPLGAVPASKLLVFLCGLPKLTTIYLDNTGLETFPDVRQLGRNLTLLQFLNPKSMTCDCRVAWMKEPSALGMVTNGLDVKNTSRVCARPAALRTRVWKDITLEDLCTSYTTQTSASSTSDQSSSPLTPSASTLYKCEPTTRIEQPAVGTAVDVDVVTTHISVSGKVTYMYPSPSSLGFTSETSDSSTTKTSIPLTSDPSTSYTSEPSKRAEQTPVGTGAVADLMTTSIDLHIFTSRKVAYLYTSPAPTGFISESKGGHIVAIVAGVLGCLLVLSVIIILVLVNRMRQSRASLEATTIAEGDKDSGEAADQSYQALQVNAVALEKVNTSYSSLTLPQHPVYYNSPQDLHTYCADLHTYENAGKDNTSTAHTYEYCNKGNSTKNNVEMGSDNVYDEI